METAIVLVIVLLILVVAAVVLMNMNTNKNTEAITEAQEKINKLKNSIAETRAKALQDRSDRSRGRQVQIAPMKRSSVYEEEPEDDIVYLKSAATVDVQSPDIVKKKISIQSDENRASVMESQNIVENDAKKKSEESDDKIAPRVMSKGPESLGLRDRVINKGPDSMKLSPIFMEKLQSAARKVKEQERNEEIKRGIDRARHMGPMPSPELIRMGPPKMVRPAVCRDLPGSPFDSCGRPSSVGSVRTATQIQV
tara:strand:- start:1870 stop:2628 length:759 start_codon:yes stop_codon:yes gene_type:complete